MGISLTYTLECHSLSDDEPEPADEHYELQPVEDPVKAARALYNFEGKAEFRELTVEAGDELNILKEEAGDGWSLVRVSSGEIGLLTQTYYTCATSFLSAPLAVHGRNEPPISTITPQASFQHQSKPLSIVPQDTGEWTNPLPSFRQSLLRGKTLNRFSGFVTSGAEEWVLEGYVDPVIPSSSSSHQQISTEDSINDDNTRLSRLGLGKQTLALRLSGAYTMYSVTSLFSSATDESYDPYIPPISPTRITVQRRFSHFIVLHTSTKRLPGIALPPLPEKQYAGWFSAVLSRLVDRRLLLIDGVDEAQRRLSGAGPPDSSPAVWIPCWIRKTPAHVKKKKIAQAALNESPVFIKHLLRRGTRRYVTQGASRVTVPQRSARSAMGSTAFRPSDRLSSPSSRGSESLRKT
ncbi:uncharacterized protein F5891DRAFT_1187482 [Suillus fuscotomentosus]|uniref:SH3 domain-containing protein n=1 Tax=Suillus fuscotomentosus TaxID=1912939 RepID=A0AAD4E8M3_9AGAM|nr:uncharacterized protein F5891DRAFT_1187482 [Suillus fuscotomentosus]KAG1901612.1 hypothetical protein F5891DRAFT_1187482 [Suillus fuscotomentosus]